MSGPQVISRADARAMGILPDAPQAAEASQDAVEAPQASTPSDVPAQPGLRGMALLRTPSLDEGPPVSFGEVRRTITSRVPDQDHPGQWLDRVPEPAAVPQSEPVEERQLLSREAAGLDHLPLPANDVEAAEELLLRSRKTGIQDVPTKTPPYAYWVLDGTELVQEPYRRKKRVLRVEKDPVMRELMDGQVVFVMGETPYSLSELYRKARRRDFKLGMRLMKVNGVVGTILHNAGWLHMWSERRPIADVLLGDREAASQ